MTVGERDDAALWDVTTPARSHRVASVAMAGFRDLGRTPDGLRLIPHPVVTLAVMFGTGSITVAYATGREQRGSLVAGLGFGSVRVQRAEKFRVPADAPVPGDGPRGPGRIPADLNGAVVALDDLWGREASRIAEQLDDASSWEDRFTIADALLARRCETGPPVDPEVAWAWNQIVVSRGQVRVERLAAELGNPARRAIPGDRRPRMAQPRNKRVAPASAVSRGVVVLSEVIRQLVQRLRQSLRRRTL